MLQTVYRQCLKDNDIPATTTIPPNYTTSTHLTTAAADNGTVTEQDIVTRDSLINDSLHLQSRSVMDEEVVGCSKPWSYVPDSVLPILYHIVYWTTQCLTW